jgi:WD40 repeat protein
LALARKHLLASGHADGKIKLWDLYSNKCVKVLTGHEGEVSSIALLNHELFASAP